MRINPKTVTLCTLERDEIRAGLELRRDALARAIARKLAHLKRNPAAMRVRWQMENLERQAARVADLLATFAD